MYKEYNSKSGIYKFTNLVNNKIYIGQAVDLFQRWCSHKGCYDDCYIHRAIKKHGWNNFRFEVLETCEKDKLIEREQHYLDFYKSYDRKIGYNIRRFADTKYGYSHSEKTKRKISLTKTGRKATPEERKRRSEFSKLRKPSSKFFERAITSKYKTVYQFNLNNEIVNRWESAKKVHETLDIKYGTLIAHCKSLAKKPLHNYRWRYTEILQFKKI